MDNLISQDKTDSRALEDHFQNLQPSIRSFLYRLTASREDAEDLAQDTFTKAYEKIDTFKGQSSFKTWLFTIASNLAQDHFRAKKRWSVYAQDIGKKNCPSGKFLTDRRDRLQSEGLQAQFEIKEHVNHCFTCITKSIKLEQQVALILKEIYSFKIKEISMIMSKTETSVKHLIHNARETMKDIFEDRCALIRKQGVCYQCSELNQIMNPHHDAEKEVLKLEMAREGQNKDADKNDLFELRLKLVRSIDPFNSPGADFQISLMDFMRGCIGDQ